MTNCATIDQQFELTIHDFQLFQKLMYSTVGILLPEKKIPLVKNRLKKRLVDLNLNYYGAYYKYLVHANNPDELQICINELTTNETFFFRHKSHWDFIINNFIPQWREKNTSSEAVRAWSAASSTGEEAYSLAIVLRDMFTNKPSSHLVVDASDINQDVLSVARKGVYSPYAVQKLTTRCLSEYFIPHSLENSYQLKSESKQLVNFSHHNLMTEKVGQQYDLILIRNVLIYFDEESKKTVMGQLDKALKPGGYIIFGGAETLPALQDKYSYIMPTIYRKK